MKEFINFCLVFQISKGKVASQEKHTSRHFCQVAVFTLEVLSPIINILD